MLRARNTIRRGVQKPASEEREEILHTLLRKTYSFDQSFILSPGKIFNISVCFVIVIPSRCNLWCYIPTLLPRNKLRFFGEKSKNDSSKRAETPKTTRVSQKKL